MATAETDTSAKVDRLVEEINRRTAHLRLDPAFERYRILGTLADPIELLLEYVDPQTSFPVVRTHWRPAHRGYGGTWTPIHDGLRGAVHVAETQRGDTADHLVALRHGLARKLSEAG